MSIDEAVKILEGWLKHGFQEIHPAEGEAIRTVLDEAKEAWKQGWAQGYSDAEDDPYLAEIINAECTAEVERLKRSAEMSELKAKVERLEAEVDIGKKFHDVAVKERDLARYQVERLKAQIKGRTLVPELEEKHRELLRERAHIEAALALHKPGPDGYCTECADPTRGECDTVKALKGEGPPVGGHGDREEK